MELTTRIEQDICIIELKGDLDLYASALLDEAIKKAIQEAISPKKLYVDCSELHFISSVGLGVFIDNIQRVETHHVAMVLYGMNIW